MNMCSTLQSTGPWGLLGLFSWLGYTSYNTISVLKINLLGNSHDLFENLDVCILHATIKNVLHLCKYFEFHEVILTEWREQIDNEKFI